MVIQRLKQGFDGAHAVVRFGNTVGGLGTAHACTAKAPVADELGLSLGVCLYGVDVADGQLLAWHNVYDSVDIVGQCSWIEKVGTVWLAAMINA